MLIDWFTIVAQIVNFLILVYLLKRFLYGPILKAIETREKEIGERFRTAAEKQVKAEQEAEFFRRKTQMIEEELPRRLKEIEEEAEKRRRELLAQGKAEVEDRRRTWRTLLAREEQNFLQELKRRTGSEVVHIAGHALEDLADVNLGEKLASKFCERLETLVPEEKEEWSGAVAQGEVTVRSTFDLGESTRHQIILALQKICDREALLNFRTDSDMPLGLELTAGGMRLSWGVEAYFQALEKRVGDLLKEQELFSELPAATWEESDERGSQSSGQDPGDNFFRP